MKIAIIHRYYPQIGGVTGVVDFLKKGLSKKEEVRIITGIRSKKEKGVEVLESPLKKIPLRYFFILGFYFKLFKYLKKEKFDIIHTQSSPICYFSPFLKEKIILTTHGFEKDYESLPWYSKIRVFLVSKGKIFSYKMADKIIAISNLVKNNLVREYNIPREKIDVIYDGIDTDMFKPKKRKRVGEKVRIFSYGTNERKGFPFILEIAPEIIKECPNVKFVIVGKKANLPKKLIPFFEFHENVPFKKMPEIYNNVDIVLLASKWDPFGLTASEGMACRKPAIISKYSGVKEVIKNGENGIVCDFKDFKKNIIFLVKNKNKRESIGKEARKTILNKLSSEAIVKKHLKLYKKIIREDL